MDGLAFDDMDEFARELDDPIAELDQDVVHILLEVFGSNPDVTTRGVGLVQALSGPANRIPGMEAHAKSQLEDDPRIDRATVTISPTDARGAYRVDLVILVNNVELGAAYAVDSAGGVRRIT